ncbi:MAG TPA: TadE/TadG family type IV pilus assembly protein [Actinomycetota bacterium]|nr:TadE/TadG family type IV pilus assembly protein [Actinomycetota bacterium]
MFQVGRQQQGQSTVEFALVLPLVLLLILGLLQIGVLVRDQILVLGAAREGVREAIVNSDRGAISAAADGAAPGLELSVQVSRGTKRGDAAKVQVSAAPAKLPLVGSIVEGMTLKASATMRMEKSDDAGS